MADAKASSIGMVLFKKKADVISDRARALNDEIAQLEGAIKKLDARLQRDQEKPRLRSTALPHGGTTLNHPAPEAPSAAPAAPQIIEPIFEHVDVDRLQPHTEIGTTRHHYNELGVRKYDLPAMLNRVKHQLQGPSTTNPRLVNYLAAGGIQGLRPLRYEKRVARNRVILLVIVLFLTLLGIALVFWKR
jgi:hypothetical protein